MEESKGKNSFNKKPTNVWAREFMRKIFIKFK
jgi:hypothetical protein